MSLLTLLVDEVLDDRGLGTKEMRFREDLEDLYAAHADVLMVSASTVRLIGVPVNRSRILRHGRVDFLTMSFPVRLTT